MTILPYTHKPAPIIHLSKRQEKVVGKGLRVLKARIADGIFPRPNLNEVRCVPVIGMELEVEAVKPLKPEYRDNVSILLGPGSPGNIAHISNEVDQEGNELAFYYKRDSSLQNGMEIVTHPRSIESWRENRHKISDLLRHLRDMGVRSYDTGRCGLHFHISKASFNSPLHMYKFARFWSDNFKLSFALSRRSESSMRTFSFIQTNPAPIAAATHFAHRRRGGGGAMSQVREHVMIEMPHHSAVTFTQATVEIRIFRGTMNFLTILSTMELIDKVIQWTANQSVKELQAEKLVATILGTKKNKKVIKLLKLKKEVKPSNIADENNLELRYKETFAHLSRSYSKCATVETWCGVANKYEMQRHAKRKSKETERKKLPYLEFLVEAPVLSRMDPAPQALTDNGLNAFIGEPAPSATTNANRPTYSTISGGTAFYISDNIPTPTVRREIRDWSNVEPPVIDDNMSEMQRAMDALSAELRARNRTRAHRSLDPDRQMRGGQDE